MPKQKTSKVWVREVFANEMSAARSAGPPGLWESILP
jgi:hypothetical protein